LKDQITGLTDERKDLNGELARLLSIENEYELLLAKLRELEDVLDKMDKGNQDSDREK